MPSPPRPWSPNATDRVIEGLIVGVGCALLLAFTSACTDESSSRRTLESAGFTDIQITGWSAFSCGQDDTFSTGFTAKNPRGETVSGAVCCGMVFKACTVRF